MGVGYGPDTVFHIRSSGMKSTERAVPGACPPLFPTLPAIANGGNLRPCK